MRYKLENGKLTFDRNRAIYGGIAGAFYGIENIPQNWISGLENQKTIEAVAEGLVTLVAEGQHGDSTEDV